MKENIGGIELDLTHYPGEDLYCDGEVEDELLQIVRDYSTIEYQKIIEDRAKWPILYHLSALRANIVDWVPIPEGARVLEVGSGCGAITGKLAEKSGSVTCIDLSKKRSTINAYRNQEHKNIIIHVGNFTDIEKDLPTDYDFIFLIGVFEYGQSYTGTKQPYHDLLKLMLAHMKPEGRLVIAIENKLGLKYFAGCKEDHLGTWFSGIENYAGGGGVRTFSRNGLEQIVKECGCEEYSFYYPYPDYKFMTTLYSDERLPRQGELYDNLRNFDRDRMLLFDEKQAFDGLIRDGLFPQFSNSFLLVIGKEFQKKYVKYSNDRAPEYGIRTEIWQDEEKKKVVKKHPLSIEAKEHILGMETACVNLKKRFEGGKLLINECSIMGEDAEFEYLEGITLEEKLDQCLEEDNQEGFHLLFKEYLERISYHQEEAVSDYDLIFSNILIHGDRWTVIDYEWTFGKAITGREIAFRAVYCYILADEKRNKLNLDSILELLNLTEAEAESFRHQEMDFQKFVTGKHKSMAEMRESIGYRLLEPAKWVHKFDDSSEKERVQVYEDRGNGFSEEDSWFVKEASIGENIIRLELLVDGDVHKLRIDPSMDRCLVRIREIRWNGAELNPERKLIEINGRRIKNGCYVFRTEDPNINFSLLNLERKAENEMSVEMEVIRLPEAMSADLYEGIRKLPLF